MEKRGTCKTTIVGVFARLADNTILADSDVDASNLPLILDSDINKKEKFMGSQIAIKNLGCIECGKYEEACRLDVITKDFEIDELKCEIPIVAKLPYDDIVSKSIISEKI